MGCQITRSHQGPFESIILGNGIVSAELIPGLGGRVWNLRDHAADKQWIWHNPNVPLRKCQPADAYDDNWSGGWEELFPNDAAGTFEGRDLPDHGEWWSSAWSWQAGREADDVVEVTLRHQGPITRADCTKTYTLRRDSRTLDVRYSIRNTASTGMHFLFKQHLAVALAAGDRIDLPGGVVTAVDRDFSTRIDHSVTFRWPHSSPAVDLSIAPPPEQRHREFVYVAELPEPWCGVTDAVTGASLRMHYSAAALPFVWLFMTYGGWRDLYTAVLEPCTNMPKDLNEALRTNRCAFLPAGDSFETAVRVELRSN